MSHYLVHTPETWPLYHLSNLSIVICIRVCLRVWERNVSWRTTERSCKFLFLPPWSLYARKFSTHATIFGWFMVNFTVTHGLMYPVRPGLSRKKQVPRDADFFFAYNAAFIRILIHQHQQLCWTGKHTCYDACRAHKLAPSLYQINNISWLFSFSQSLFWVSTACARVHFLLNQTVSFIS